MTTHKACLRTAPQPLCFCFCLNNWKGQTQHSYWTFFSVGCKQRPEYYLVLCVLERQQVQLPGAAPLEAMINKKDPKWLVLLDFQQTLTLVSKYHFSKKNSLVILELVVSPETFSGRDSCWRRLRSYHFLFSFSSVILLTRKFAWVCFMLGTVS